MKQWVCNLMALKCGRKSKKEIANGAIFFEAEDFWSANEYVLGFIKQEKLEVSFCKISERIME